MVLDLSTLKGLDDETNEAALVYAQIEAGIRCRGCSAILSGGLRFHLFEVKAHDDPTKKAMITRQTVGACMGLGVGEDGEPCAFHEQVFARGFSVAEPVSYLTPDALSAMLTSMVVGDEAEPTDE